MRHREWLLLRGDRLLTRTLVDYPQAVLILPQPFRTGGGHRGRRYGGGRSRRCGMTGEHDDPEDTDREAHHDPRLGIARDHAARRGPLIDHWRCAGNCIGHDYRPCWNENLSFPSARYPRSITFGTTYVPLCTWKLTSDGWPSLT